MHRRAWTPFVVAILLALLPCALGQEPRVWQPKPAPASARIRPENVPIVDYGDDYAWYYALHTYRGLDQAGIEMPDARVDADGDGDASDDAVTCFPFSLEEPLNPLPPCWDLGGNSARFYGGMTLFYANASKHPDFQFSEMCTNVDHGFERDNINMMVTNAISRRAWGKITRGSAPPYRVYGIWLWKKEDFMNGGAEHRVAFSDESRIALHTARYWAGVDEGRWVVQDGESFYISEDTFVGALEKKRVPPHYFQGVTRSVVPTKAKWAPYDPKPPYHIDYCPDKLKFAEHAFKDVRCVGYVIAKHDPRVGEYTTGVKLEAFEVEAVVHRPWRPSESIAMVKLPTDALPVDPNADAAEPGLYMSATEVPYALYRKVHRWSVSNMYAYEPGYVYDRDGDMGSMDFGFAERGPDEPATDMTWLDALAWCNALSEMEGRMPCYYIDPEHTQAFRKVIDRSGDDPGREPHIYLNWKADGYRLPTIAEWASAYEWFAPGRESMKTLPVGSSEPNRLQFYDMADSVREYVWEGRLDCDAARVNSHTVLGIGMSYVDPLRVSSSPWRDRPFRGAWDIGFRIVRNVDIDAPPAFLAPPAEPGLHRDETYPAWTFTRETQTHPMLGLHSREIEVELPMVPLPGGRFATWGGAVQNGEPATIEMSPFSILRTETTFRMWHPVYMWATAQGYEFAHDGDMGSMYMQGGAGKHSPDEPVTRISWYDAVVWCNALSEKEGRRPCYYLDEGFTEVYRKAVQLHMPMAHYGQNVAFKAKEKLYVDWSADGYRLPTQAEWEYACRAGSSDIYYWGPEFDDSYLWCAENSGNRTHPVAQKRPNAFGLYDMVGNVFEWIGDMPSSTYGKQDEKDPVSWYELKPWASGSMPIRGGSFRFPHLWKGTAHRRPFYSGRTYRFNVIAHQSYPEIGFRIVRRPAGSRAERPARTQ